MLVIRAQQMEVLGAYMAAAFEKDCVALLRRDYPEITRDAPDDELRAFVRDGIERAAQYGIDTVSNVQRWLDLMMRLGAHFDEDPRCAAVQAALAKDALPAEARLDEAMALAV